MMAPLPDADQKVVDGLVQVAKWINGVILCGLGIALGVCILRITNQVEFTVLQVKLKLSAFAYIVLGLTLAHAFFTWGFTQEVQNVSSLGQEAKEVAWRNLRESDAFIFNGMKPRVWHPSAFKLVRGFYVARTDDRAFVASTVFALGLEIATYLSLTGIDEKLFVPSRKAFNRLSIGSALAIANWMIGSQWAIAASSLAK